MRHWFGLALILACSLLAPNAMAQEFGVQTVRDGEPKISADGEQTFRLFPGECSSKVYGSKRLQTTTSDCDRKRTRVELFERDADWAREGDRKQYSWEIFIPKDFSYSATGGHLIVGQFHNSEDLLLSFALSNDGYTIRSKPCIRPDEFGAWHKVEVRYVFDSTRKKTFKDKTPGVLVVTCNGREIVSASGRPNVMKGSKVQFRYGLYGALDFPASDNVSVRFRNVRIGDW